MRILVTGSREWTDAKSVAIALVAARKQLIDEGYDRAERPTLVHGGAMGADQIAAEVAGRASWNVECHKPNYDAQGRKAPLVRNVKMVSLGAEICLAFFLSRYPNAGTKHCSDLAVQSGITVIRIWGDMLGKEINGATNEEVIGHI